MQPTGVLLINLGTPDNTGVSAIRRYLREFLSDWRVIDLPAPLRYLIVYGAILPFRPFKTAKAYRKIWQPEGSPLLLHSNALRDDLASHLGPDYHVALGMRYGNPSIASALAQLTHCQRIIVLPLFPQYASAATGSAIEATLKALQTQWNLPHLTVVNSFYQMPGFIDAYAERIRPHLNDPDTFLLLSYHGLPERHLDKSDCTAHCDRRHACPATQEENQFCYRAQCYRTSEALVEALSLPTDQHMTTFQSRLGRIPWIKPYTDEQLSTLRKRGIKKLAIACPAFVADCLETLEEIGMAAKADWLAMGGESFQLIPCLNNHPTWVNALAKHIAELVQF